MAAPVALIQGASRGLGLQFCKHLLNHKAAPLVVATCRSPFSAPELQQLAEQHRGRLEVVRCDITMEEEIRSAAESVSADFGKLDLMVNCSAMLHPSGKGETSLRDISAEGVLSTLATNTVGPLLMAKYFSPLLQKGTGSFGHQSQEKKSQHKGVMVNITARVGSIGDNGLGGWYSYRMSKTALNMATRNLAIELARGQKKVVCLGLHPGTVDTDLSRPYQKNVAKDKLFSSEQSVSYMMGVVDRLGMEASGKVFAWDGQQIPW